MLAFPNKTRNYFLKYFETPRYHNILLTKWVEKYKHKKEILKEGYIT